MIVNDEPLVHVKIWDADTQSLHGSFMSQLLRPWSVTCTVYIWYTSGSGWHDTHLVLRGTTEYQDTSNTEYNPQHKIKATQQSIADHFWRSLHYLTYHWDCACFTEFMVKIKHILTNFDKLLILSRHLPHCPLFLNECIASQQKQPY